MRFFIAKLTNFRNSAMSGLGVAPIIAGQRACVADARAFLKRW